MDYLNQLLKAGNSSRDRTNSRQSAVMQLLNASLETPDAPVGSAPIPTAGGKKPAGNVAGWINEALGVLHLDHSYAQGIANMIQKESGGNPNAINKWDSNAKAGHPSQGLMQTIPTTFRQYALNGYNNDITDPVSNIIAGIRYARSRYGDNMLKSGGRKTSSGKYLGY